ncbi:uracil-DNA glycosylase [Trichothermofontia sp.]
MTHPEQMSLFDLAPETPGPEPSLPAVAVAPSPPDFNPDLIPTAAAIPIPPGTYGDIAALTAHCRQCQRCDLASTRTHVVVDRGHPQADIMIIGEGPGQNEDETGLPFVGKAGQLLEKILESVALNSEQDVYICNMVKCRPPGNRVPTPEEMAACRPYLLEQIRLVDPKIILLTGATAVRGVTGHREGITKIRGQWLPWEGRLCMPIFHPAYLLRNPSREKGSPKWLMWQDIQTVKAKLTELRSAAG